MARKEAKPRRVPFSLIDPTAKPPHEAYRLLAEVREKWHDQVEGARIALAWKKGIKRDKDGRLMLGKCMKASDLQRELVAWDCVILLNKDVWQEPGFDEKKKRALLDHELCHAEVSLDKHGHRVTDEKGRSVWRVRGHDIEEFRSVVQHHGCYKHDLELFAEDLLKKAKTPLFNKSEKPAEAAGMAN